MQIRDRIRDFRRVRASDLQPNPRNWRTHPAEQQNALRALLAEVGFAGALLTRELADGSLQLIDGHLRAETTPEQRVPVLVLDVSEAEANKLLAFYDPLAALAGRDAERAAQLAAEVQTSSSHLQALLSRRRWCGGNLPVRRADEVGSACTLAQAADVSRSRLSRSALWRRCWWRQESGPADGRLEVCAFARICRAHFAARYAAAESGRWLERVGFDGLCGILDRLNQAWQPAQMWIENEKLGQAAVDVLGSRLPLRTIATQSRDKVARAAVLIDKLQRGEIFLPKHDLHWRPQLEAEFLAWTGDPQEAADQIDAAAYAAIVAGKHRAAPVQLSTLTLPLFTPVS